MRIDSDGVGIELEVVGEGRPVVLLHGFPDSARIWREQVSALAAAGFQAIVPDQRGYGSSDKPTGVEAYSLPFLAADVVAVLDHLGIDRAHIVGHDWGSAVAWLLGALEPDRVDHLATVSVGHPTAFASVGYEQQVLSWYMLLFGFPGIAERWLSDNGWANFRRWTQHPDADGVIADFERDGSLTPALSWYRANIGPESLVEPPPVFPDVVAPTMGVWSTGDFALTEAQMVDSSKYVAGTWRYERLVGPGHWIQLDAPQALNELLIDFLPA